MRLAWMIMPNGGFLRVEAKYEIIRNYCKFENFFETVQKYRFSNQQSSRVLKISDEI